MRHVYLVAYDISDPRRLQRVMKTVRDFGDRVQLSVFLCQLSEKDLVVLQDRLRERINQREDQVIFVKLGPLTKGFDPQATLAHLGRPVVVRDLKVLVF